MTHEISCEEVIDRLLEYLDRELDAETEAQLDRHIETCRGCFSRAEFERRLRARVNDTARAKAPDSLRARVRGMIERF